MVSARADHPQAQPGLAGGRFVFERQCASAAYCSKAFHPGSGSQSGQPFPSFSGQSTHPGEAVVSTGCGAVAASLFGASAAAGDRYHQGGLSISDDDGECGVPSAYFAVGLEHPPWRERAYHCGPTNRIAAVFYYVY